MEARDFARQKSMRRPVTATKIIVGDNQIEPALKALKKQVPKDGLLQEMKRLAYEKPSVKRKRKQAAARKKRRKAMRRMEDERD